MSRRSYRGLLRGFRKWPYIPAFILVVLVFAAIAAPLISPYDPVKGDLRGRSKPPIGFGGTTEHIFGTDNQGRDIFSRIIHGARVSMSFAAITMLLSVALGAVIGAASGYFGGHIDEALMRLVDLQNALPFILAALVAVGVFGASFTTLLIIIAIFSWGTTARQIRGEILQLKQMDYVNLARIAGASSPRIIFKHLLPGVTNTLIVVATLGTGQIILTRSHPEFPRRGYPAAQARLGQYGLLRQKLHRLRMVDRRHTRRRNSPRRRVAEFPGRLAARLLRPALTADLGAVAQLPDRYGTVSPSRSRHRCRHNSRQSHAS